MALSKLIKSKAGFDCSYIIIDNIRVSKLNNIATCDLLFYKDQAQKNIDPKSFAIAAEYTASLSDLDISRDIYEELYKEIKKSKKVDNSETNFAILDGKPITLQDAIDI